MISINRPNNSWSQVVWYGDFRGGMDPYQINLTNGVYGFIVDNTAGRWELNADEPLIPGEWTSLSGTMKSLPSGKKKLKIFFNRQAVTQHTQILKKLINQCSCYQLLAGRDLVELTNHCNLSCKHCFDKRHDADGYLNIQTLETILHNAQQHGFDYLSLTGGEPTLHPEFQIYFHAHPCRKRNLTSIGKAMSPFAVICRDMETGYLPGMLSAI